MSAQTIIALAAIGLVTIVVVLLALRFWNGHRFNKLSGTLVTEPVDSVFDVSMVDHVPEPARRYLLHSIRPGTPLAKSVRLSQAGSMKPNPTSDRADLKAEERLTPFVGFAWHANVQMGQISVSAWDHYFADEGAVRIALFGVIPLETSEGTEVARSSRHRLAAETLWVPTALLPGPEVSWEGLDNDLAVATLTIDGEDIPLTFEIDEDGAVRSVTMQRYGDIGEEPWELLPYGFEVLAEQTFGGITIPSRLRGGWWFGSERYDPASASQFDIVGAEFQ
jgi:hypothetical protein